jgi:hypothetical protein
MWRGVAWRGVAWRGVEDWDVRDVMWCGVVQPGAHLLIKSSLSSCPQGVMAAEVIAHFLPRLIETHNYQSCAGRKQKKGNWDTLNKKVLKRFQKLHIPDNVIEAIIA